LARGDGGGDWGNADDAESMRAPMRRSIAAELVDTADVYGDGRSERLVGRLRRERSHEIIIATGRPSFRADRGGRHARESDGVCRAQLRNLD
jgi:aryl-alcohol dehydrogenase-like predicted oxidoreductase